MRIACVGAIISDGAGRIVVIRRGRPPALGLWSVPGGRVEPSESLEAAISREVREETGLDVHVGKVAGRVVLDAGSATQLAADAATTTRTYDVTDFYAQLRDPSAPLVAGDDAVEARWVSRAELEELDTSPGLVKTLQGWGVWEVASSETCSHSGADAIVVLTP